MCHHKILFLLVLTSFVNCLEFKYHTNSELESYLKNFTKNIDPLIRTKYYTIGQSTEKTNLLVLEITATKRKLGVPNIKLIGTIHGNEPIGREILLHFLEFLWDNYHKNQTIRWLLDNTRIHFLPNLNPDGFAMASENMCGGEHGRNNGPSSQAKDLNRNFPDYFHKNRIPEAPETKAVKQWMTETPFVLSAALHGGAMVANYPFDSVKEQSTKLPNQPSLTPDDDVFQHLASVYAQNHPQMKLGKPCRLGDPERGITNGAEWYEFPGGMQDYNYAFHGCMEVTLEISCCKYPKAVELPAYWEQNKNSLLKYCMEANRGVTGQIMDFATKKPIANAKLKIQGRNITFSSFKTGEFWRLLLPGTYKLEVEASGYYGQIADFVVEEYPSDVFPKLTFLNISMINSSLSTTTTTDKVEETTTQTTELITETSHIYYISTTTRELLNNVTASKQISERTANTGNVAACCIKNIFLLAILCFLL